MSTMYNTYIKLKIGDITFGYDNTENIISLNAVRSVNDSVLQFVIEIYDYTCYDVENALINSSREVEISYGYAGDEDKKTWKGYVTKVTPSFSFNGERLTIEGIANLEYKSIMESLNRVYVGKPSDIFKQACKDAGWQVGVVVDTKELVGDVYCGNIWRIEKHSSETMHAFLNRLAVFAETESGEANYQVILDETNDMVIASFIPFDEITNFRPGKDYSVTVGIPSDVVIEFTPNCNNISALLGSTGITSESIDTLTGEEIQSTYGTYEHSINIPVTGTNTGNLDAKVKDRTVNACIYNSTADLILKGDSSIVPGNFIDVKVVTRQGKIHRSSGKYFISSIEDLIDNGKFTTTLSLQKIDKLTFDDNPYSKYKEGAKYFIQEAKGNAVFNWVGSTDIGTFTAFGYCPCKKCAEKYHFQSGSYRKTGYTNQTPSQGRTVAMLSDVVPVGTKVMWEDPVLKDATQIRTIEDRLNGLKQDMIGVYFEKHSDVEKFGTHSVLLRYAKQEYSHTAPVPDSVNLDLYSVNHYTTGNKNKAETPEAIPSDVPQSDVLEAVKPYLGIPYVSGGKVLSKSGGFDCSGFSGSVMRSLGCNPVIETNWNAAKQSVNGEAIASLADARPGDLLFHSENGKVVHVVIYLGNNYIAHAPDVGKVICIQKKYSGFNLTSIRRYL